MAGGWLRDADDHITRWAKAVGALATAIGAVLGTVFVLVPWLKPDEPCADERRAVLSELVVDRNVTYGGYLRLLHQSTDGVAPELLRRPGKLLGFRIEVVGYKGQRLPIRWTMLAPSGEPIDDAEFVDRLALAVGPESCSDAGARRVWTPVPVRPGSYMTELVLFDQNAGELDTARTQVFRVPA